MCMSFSDCITRFLQIRPLFQKFVESPMEFPNPQPRVREIDWARWSATEIAEQLTLIDAFQVNARASACVCVSSDERRLLTMARQYYAMSPEELFSVGEAAGAPHITALLARTQLVSR